MNKFHLKFKEETEIEIEIENKYSTLEYKCKYNNSKYSKIIDYIQWLEQKLEEYENKKY